jgi:dihydrofolate synthase/folylpolyglutamate synthase
MVEYKEVIHFLMQQLPMFSTNGKMALKPGLENIIALCEALDNPQMKFPSIHIAGTNGKGSTSHMMAAALQQSGYRVGLYTSPHLVDLRERIRINGEMIEKSFVIQFVNNHKAIIETIQPSYFELNVAMAFLAFAEAKVDIAVIEVGLGGRLDSTNIITPILSIITNIGYDHTDILGNTLPLIAKEKAGIIKEQVPVVVGETHPETEQVFFLEALHQKTSVIFADSIWELVKIGQGTDYQLFKAINKATNQWYDIKTDLLGAFQQHNIKTVLTASHLLMQQGWNTTLEQTIESLSQVKTLTHLRGRWEILSTEPQIILDVAHNSDGLHYLQQNLSQTSANAQLHIVCGFVKDKDVTTALHKFPKEALYYFTQAQIPRALDHHTLHHTALNLGFKGNAYATVTDAILAAQHKASKQDTILITGSFFIVGEAITSLEETITTE